MPSLLRIEAPHFVAGVELRRMPTVLIAWRTAPIVKYMKSWGILQIEAYCRRKGWRVLTMFQCWRCKRVSYNRNDLCAAYCGACDKFNDD